jgi:acyl phosphate:glycerol-3-phosphate acyltransferase
MLIQLSLILGVYLICSFNSALFICRYFDWEDVRVSGSKNPGTTNMFRQHGPLSAVIVLLGDTLKGYIAISMVTWFSDEHWTIVMSALMALFGHMYPIFYRFKGGKGVAVSLGVLVALAPWIALITIIVWLLLLKITRVSSISGLVACIVAPITATLLNSPYTLLFAVLGILIMIKHLSNIKRLFGGDEPKL